MIFGDGFSAPFSQLPSLGRMFLDSSLCVKFWTNRSTESFDSRLML